MKIRQCGILEKEMNLKCNRCNIDKIENIQTLFEDKIINTKLIKRNNI